MADGWRYGSTVSQDLQLLRTLMATRTPEKFDLARYQDRYTQKLTQLIEAKVAGKEIIAAPATTPMQVINLVEALRQSVAQMQKAAPKKEKPDASAKKKNASAKTKPTGGRKVAITPAAVA